MNSQSNKYVFEKENNVFTVAVEGNIGSGKSTFLRLLQKRFFDDVEIHSEAVDRWQNVSGSNLLKLMYDDPSRWSMVFQSYVQLTTMQAHSMKASKPIKLLERSLYSGRKCFIENLYQSGKLPSSEYCVLDEWYKTLRSICNIDRKMDLFVYLRTTPEVAWQRVKDRSRPEESIVPLKYIEDLHQLHEGWLLSKDDSDVPAPVLIVDSDPNLHNFPDLFDNVIEEIFSKAKESNMKSSISNHVLSPSRDHVSIENVNKFSTSATTEMIQDYDNKKCIL